VSGEIAQICAVSHDDRGYESELLAGRLSLLARRCGYTTSCCDIGWCTTGLTHVKDPGAQRMQRWGVTSSDREAFKV
jgi:hypothetical protein